MTTVQDTEKCWDNIVQLTEAVVRGATCAQQSRQVAAACVSAAMRTAWDLCGGHGDCQQEMWQREELQRAALNAHEVLNQITGTTHHTLGQATKEAERTLRLDAEEKRTLRRLRRKANIARHVWVPVQTSAMETRARGTTVATQTEPDYERQAQETSSTQKPGNKKGNNKAHRAEPRQRHLQSQY